MPAIRLKFWNVKALLPIVNIIICNLQNRFSSLIFQQCFVALHAYMAVLAYFSTVKYFLPVYCFLLFNVGDLIGRTLAGVINLVSGVFLLHVWPKNILLVELIFLSYSRYFIGWENILILIEQTGLEWARSCKSEFWMWKYINFSFIEEN